MSALWQLHTYPWLWLTDCHFRIWTQRVASDIWNPSDIWSEWCLDKKTKIQKDKSIKTKKRVQYCDIRAVSHAMFFSRVPKKRLAPALLESSASREPHFHFLKIRNLLFWMIKILFFRLPANWLALIVSLQELLVIEAGKWDLQMKQIG